MNAAYVPVPPETKTCTDCGKDYESPAKDTTSIRCTPCREAWRAEQWARWNRNNAGKVALTRAMRRLAVQEGEEFDPQEVFARDCWICQICGDPVSRDIAFPHPESPTLDHVVPLARGGVHTRDNTQLAHFTCNVRKGARMA